MAQLSAAQSFVMDELVSVVQRIGRALAPLWNVSRPAMNNIYDMMYGVSCTILLMLAAVSVATFALPVSNPQPSYIATAFLLIAFFTTLSIASFRLLIKLPCNPAGGSADNEWQENLTWVGRCTLLTPIILFLFELSLALAFIISGLEELPSALYIRYIIGVVVLVVLLLGSAILFVFIGRRPHSMPNDARDGGDLPR